MLKILHYIHTLGLKIVMILTYIVIVVLITILEGMAFFAFQLNELMMKMFPCI